MKTYYIEGIGSLHLTPAARTLSTCFLVLGFICLGIVGITGLLSLMIMKRGAMVPAAITIPAGIAFLMCWVFLGMVYLIRQKYSFGDLYYELDHDLGNARDSARTLLKLTDADIVTYKLQSKAHLYLAYKGEKDHWLPMITVATTILDQEPDNVAFRLDRAQAYQNLGNYDNALKDLDVAIAGTEQPTLRALSMRISCLTALKRLGEAESDCDELERSIERFPNKNEATRAVALHRAEILQRKRAANPEVEHLAGG